jgi:PKD repeat protein
VSFLASATDADNDPLTFSWVFGDGNQGTGSNPKHSYSAPGTYAVAVTVTDGRGGSGTQALSLVVQDEDATKFAMLLQFVNGKTDFNATGKDLVKVAGVIPNLPPGQLFDGQTVSVDLGGVIKTFQLNAKGRGRSAEGAFRMKLKFEKDPATGKKVFVGGDTSFRALVRKGSVSGQWSALGMAAEAAPLTLPFEVDLRFDAKTYTDSLDTVYSAKGGLGKFKSKP